MKHRQQVYILLRKLPQPLLDLVLGYAQLQEVGEELAAIRMVISDIPRSDKWLPIGGRARAAHWREHGFQHLRTSGLINN